jgi:hypothetical protein
MRWLVFGCLLLPLSACGDYPQPFLGNPGATAMRLREPPEPRLAVPTPGTALLSDSAGRQFAVAIAERLQQGEVPAFAQPATSTDWRLVVSAEDDGPDIVPSYTVLNPQGKSQGTVKGKPVPVAIWAAADPATLKQAAVDDAPAINSLLTRIENGLMQADPNSLYNRAAKVNVPQVTGAPGDGNLALTRQLRTRLAALGPEVVTAPAGADFTVQGQVKVVPIAGGQQRVEIQWIITNAKGREGGRVVQLNEIPAGTLDHYWGDVAAVVAQEASGGVNEVIRRQSGHEPSGSAPPEQVGVAQPQPSAKTQ